MTKTACNFDASIKKEQGKYLQKIISMSTAYITGGHQNSREFFNQQAINEPWNEDQKKLLYLYFLSCIGMSWEEIETRYINGIFALDNDERIAEHLYDFIVNAKI